MNGAVQDDSEAVIKLGTSRASHCHNVRALDECIIDGHPLLTAWQAHRLDPANPPTLACIVRDLAVNGGVFADELPDDL